MGFRSGGTIEDRVNPRMCTCDSKPGKCPWHLGRFSTPPRLDEPHPIPRIKGISHGAWLLFVALHRGMWWAVEGSRPDFSPGRKRMRRYIGGRNARTRPLDELGRPSVGPRYEKGEADASTVTAYLHELRGARLYDGRPLLYTQRHPNAPMSIHLHPEVLVDPQESYETKMVWELGTDVLAHPEPTTPNGASARSAESDTSLSEMTLSRLGGCTPKPQGDVETETVPALLAEAAGSSWWASWVESVGSLEYARRELGRSLRQLLRKEKVTSEAVRHVFALLTFNRERQHKQPGSYMGWFLTACRKGWHVPAPKDPAAAAAALIAAEQAELARVRGVMHRAELAQAPAADAEPGEQLVPAELTTEEHAELVERMREGFVGARPTPTQAPGAVS